jgi:hypothetical protein
MMSRAGLKDASQSCGDIRHDSDGRAASDSFFTPPCAHLLSWTPANHYPLLALIASRLPIHSVVVEIGTMHGAAAFALRAGLDEACRQKGFLAVDCPSVVITYNIVDDAAHNAKDCGVTKDTWMQVRVFKEMSLGSLRVFYGLPAFVQNTENSCLFWRKCNFQESTSLTRGHPGRAWSGVCVGRFAANCWRGRRRSRQHGETLSTF